MTNDIIINSITLSNLPAYLGYIASGFFIIIGIIIIIQNKSHKNAIDNPKEKNNKNKKEEEQKFNTDSIFKKIPDFSNQAFFEITKKELIEQLNLNDIEITKKEIIQFIEDPNKYIMTSLIETKIDNIKKTYTIISEKNKNNDNTHLNCPTCFGKIKDTTRLRCPHCDSILPQHETINNNNWKIIEIK